MIRESHLTECGLTGLDTVPYGVHMCHFYEHREDLAATLVPYFVAGLRQRERCIWITAEPLGVADVEAVLARAGVDVATALREGSLVLRDFEDWYGTGDTLKPGLAERWLEEEERALADGYNGLRITGNTSFVKPAGWAAFMAYEAHLHRLLVDRRVVTLCSYKLNIRAPADVLDASRRHTCTLVRPDEGWQLLSTQMEPNREPPLRSR